MPKIDRAGVRIHFDHHPGDAPQAPTLLLSHGYSATSAMWQGQLQPLRKHCQLITWDMRGHGQSDSPDDAKQYSERLTVDDMAAILDACNVQQAIIGGLSLGGYMSLAFHAMYSDRCRALMLFDTGPGYKSSEGRAAWNRTADAQAAALEAHGLEALGRGAEVRLGEHRSAAGLAHAARGMLAQVSDHVIQSLPAIRVPTLVLVGANDAPFLTPADYMAAKISGARKIVLPDAGHAANLDQPASFNAAVINFIRTLGRN